MTSQVQPKTAIRKLIVNLLGSTTITAASGNISGSTTLTVTR
jgi:hypothetical protein